MSSPLPSPFILMHMHTWIKRRGLPHIRYLSHLLHLFLRRPSHLHQSWSQSSLSRIHQQLQQWILMKINHRMSMTFKFVHLEHFILFLVILWFMFSHFNFSFYVSVILNFSTLSCLLVPKSLFEQWIDWKWYAVDCFAWNECLRMIWMSNCMIWVDWND